MDRRSSLVRENAEEEGQLSLNKGAVTGVLIFSMAMNREVVFN